MPKKPPTGKDLATALCRKYPDTNSAQLGRILYDENKARFPTPNAAYLAIRRVRGLQGQRNRKINPPTVPTEPATEIWKEKCPPSAAEEWKPVEIEGPATVLVLSDIHVPYHSREAVEAAVEFGKTLEPDVVLLNGDTADFYRMSRFQQDPKKRDLAAEVGYTRDLLSWLRGQFPAARIIYKMGNHDERWDVYIWNKAPELFNLNSVQLHNVLEFEQCNIERVGDNAVMCGKLPVLHGHEIGKGIFSPVNPARGAFLRTNHTVLIGHLHRPSSHAEPNMWHDETMTWSTGCLCGLQPEYARINKWAWGFAHVDVAADGEFNVHNYRLSADYKVRTA